MEIKQIQYRIQGIDLLEKHVYRREITAQTAYNFNVRTEAGVDQLTKVIVIAIEVNITKRDDSQLCAQFRIVFAFGIKDFDTVMTKNEEGVFAIAKDLENQLKSISISTSRGIVYSELSGTNLGGAIMPIVPISSLKPEKSETGGLLSEFKGLFASKKQISEKGKSKK